MALVHIVFAAIFLLFLAVDRIYIRKRANKDRIYKLSLLPLLIVAIAIIYSGASIYHENLIKAAFGLATLALFFACPFAKFSKSGRAIYRTIVLLLAIATAIIGIVW